MQTIKIHSHPEWGYGVWHAAGINFILVALVVVLTGCGRIDTAGNGTVSSTTTQPSASAISPSATVPALADTDYTPAEKAQVEALREQLKRMDLDAQTRQSLEQKLAMIENMVKVRSAGRLQPAPKDPQADYPPTVVQAQPARPRGILQDFSSPFPAAQATIQNTWQDQIEGKWVHVYAGARGDDPKQGIVIVQTEGIDGDAGNFDRLTPIKAGGIHIVAVRGLQFTLVATNGTTFVFDLPSRSIKKANS